MAAVLPCGFHCRTRLGKGGRGRKKTSPAWQLPHRSPLAPATTNMPVLLCKELPQPTSHVSAASADLLAPLLPLPVGCSKALELVAEMRSKGIPCNIHTFSALMSVCVKCK